jgi:hypothetical protein
MVDTLVLSETHMPMFLLLLEKPQEGSQQQLLEALPLPQRLGLNPMVNLVLLLHSPLRAPVLPLPWPFLSLLPLPTTQHFQLRRRIRDLHHLLRMVQLEGPVMVMPQLPQRRRRRLHLYLRNSVYPPLQLWPRLSPRYVFSALCRILLTFSERT